MHVREMTAREVLTRFGDLRSHGLIAFEGDEEAGQAGFTTDGTSIHVHSLFSPEGGYPALFCWLRALSAETGKPITFLVDANNKDLMHLVDSGKARVVTYLIELPARGN